MQFCIDIKNFIDSEIEDTNPEENLALNLYTKITGVKTNLNKLGSFPIGEAKVRI